MDIRALPGLPDLPDGRSVVRVQPHPDDNEVGAVGTLLARFLSYQAQQLFAASNAGKAGEQEHYAVAFQLLSTRQLHFSPL